MSTAVHARRRSDTLSSVAWLLRLDWLKVIVMICAMAAGYAKLQQTVDDLKSQVQRIESRLDACGGK